MGNSSHSLLGISLSLSVDFVAAILIGLFIGHGLDFYLNTYPWGLVIFTVLGIIAGGLTIYRSIKKVFYLEETHKNDKD